MTRTASGRAVFFDRDGVLKLPDLRCGDAYGPLEIASLRPYGDAAPSVSRLKRAGYAVIIIDHVPDVGTGRVERRDIVEMHRALASRVGVDAIASCFTPVEASCRRSLPEPGMLIDAALAGRIDLNRSFLVSERASAVTAGRAAGCETILLVYNERGPDLAPNADAAARSLEGAVDWILREGEDGTNDASAGKAGRAHPLISRLRAKNASVKRLN